MTEKWRRKPRHHPLKEAGCASGWWRVWDSLEIQNRGGNYRAKLSRCGCAEESGDAAEERSRDEPGKEGSDPAAKSSNQAELK